MQDENKKIVKYLNSDEYLKTTANQLASRLTTSLDYNAISKIIGSKIPVAVSTVNVSTKDISNVIASNVAENLNYALISSKLFDTVQPSITTTYDLNLSLISSSITNVIASNVVENLNYALISSKLFDSVLSNLNGSNGVDMTVQLYS